MTKDKLRRKTLEGRRCCLLLMKAHAEEELSTLDVLEEYMDECDQMHARLARIHDVASEWDEAGDVHGAPSEVVDTLFRILDGRS